MKWNLELQTMQFLIFVVLKFEIWQCFAAILNFAVSDCFWFLVSFLVLLTALQQVWNYKCECSILIFMLHKLHFIDSNIIEIETFMYVRQYYYLSLS